MAVPTTFILSEPENDYSSSSMQSSYMSGSSEDDEGVSLVAERIYSSQGFSHRPDYNQEYGDDFPLLSDHSAHIKGLGLSKHQTESPRQLGSSRRTRLPCFQCKEKIPQCYCRLDSWCGLQSSRTRIFLILFSLVFTSCIFAILTFVPLYFVGVSHQKALLSVVLIGGGSSSLADTVKELALAYPEGTIEVSSTDSLSGVVGLWNNTLN